MKTRIKTIRILVATAVLALAVVAAHLGGNAAIGTLCALCPVGFAQIRGGSEANGPSEPPASVGKSSGSGCSTCSSCGTSSLKTQGLVLVVLLVVSFAVGFPVFCLLCPIGLVFGTLWALNRVFVLLQPGWELVVFPLMLLAELFLFKRGQAAREARLRRPPSGRLRHLHLEGGLPNLLHRVPRGHRRSGSRQGDAGGLHLLPRLRGELPHEVHQGQGEGREADNRLFRRAFRR